MTTRQPGGSTLERALLALEKMETKLAAAERAKTEPLAIVGMACRFPGGAKSPAALWQLLHAGTDAVTEVPAERWSSTVGTPHPSARWAGLLDDVEQFDAGFFGIGRGEATDMDPQHRLLLEVTWEALEDAGVRPDRIADGKVGVFVGIGSPDYVALLRATAPEPRPHVPTGNAISFAAGRIAYALGLRGPCTVVDTACSSSLVALHLASRSLRRGECDMAIVGGVNLLLSPDTTNILASLQVLSPDGRCRTFDARANGYVRAEGVGVVILERLSDAQRSADRIWALVRGTAMNQNGRATSLTAPNLQAQTAVLRAALEDARVKPERVGYVEVHSNGSPLGDPIELEALQEVLGPGRAEGSRCVLGSVKTYIGHAEAASGMASLIKAALVLHHETIPRNLHFESLNTNASLDRDAFVIPVSEIPWKRGDRPRFAGVSATGLSGANAHIVLEEPPEGPRAQDKPERPAHLFVLSAKTAEALRDQVKQMLRHVAARPEQSLGDTCHTLGVGRAHLEHRFAAVVTTHAEVLAQLSDYLDGAPGTHVHARVDNVSARKRIGFVLMGRATQARGALGPLDATPPALRAALHRADDAVQAQLGRRVLGLLQDDANARPTEDVVEAELALFVLQVALVELWRSWGVECAAVTGEGTGECVAAWASGALGLEDALVLAEARARLACSDGRDIEPLARAIAKIKLSSPRRTLIPSLGDAFSATSLGTRAYWERQVREAVDSRQAIGKLASQGFVAFLEMGPGPGNEGRRTPPDAAMPIVPSLRLDAPPIRVLLEALAALYVRGVDLHFEGVDAPHPYRRITLPTYPFQRQRYWVGTTTRISPERAAGDGHPLLGHVLDPRADRPDVRTWQLDLDESSLRSVGTRRLAGVSRLSTGGLVEVACAAARETFGAAGWEIGLSLGDPPALHPQETGRMQVIATPEGDRKASLGIFFRERSSAPWKRIAHGAIVPALVPDEDEDIAPPSMRPGRRQGVSTLLWERRLEAFGVDMDTFHIDQVWQRDAETLARVRLENPAAAMAFLRAVPAVASITHPATHGRSWMIESIEGASVRPASTERRFWLRLNWSANDGLSGRVSVELVGEDREVAAAARKIVLRAEDPATALRAAGKDPLQDAFIDLVWRETPPAIASPAAKRRWIVLADAGGVGRALAAHLEAAGDTVIVLPAADLEQRIDRLDLVLGFSGPFFGIVHLGSLDVASGVPTSPAMLEDALQKGPSAVLAIVDRVAAQAHVPRLWIVTRGAQVVENGSPAVAQAGSWGLGRVLSIERPDMWGGLIDLDPQPGEEDGLRLAQALSTMGVEDHVALRGGKRYVGRLARIPMPAPQSVQVRPDRTYVVTGAHDPLGAEATDFLIDRGAQSLLLLDAPPRDNEEREARERTARALATRGIAIAADEVDLADEGAVRQALSRARLPLGGVIHATAATDTALHRLTSRDAKAVLHSHYRQSSLALLSLHTLTASLPLDFFLVFSSASPFLGWEVLGADAVSADFADTLARLRRAEGLPATVIHLALPNEGRSSRTEHELSQLASGLQGMPPSLALQAAERMAASGLPVAMVAWVEWGLFEQSHPARMGRALLEGLGDPRSVTSGAATLKRRVAAAEPDQARRIVESAVRGEIAHVLGVSPADLPANDQDLSVLGMNSIMGVQVLSGIGSAFGVNLPVRVLLAHPTVEGLSRRVLGTLRSGHDDAAAGPLSRRGLLVELNREGANPPFFLAPPLTGSALAFQSLAQHFGADRPLYGFNAPGIDTDAPPCDRIEVLAARFVEAMRQAQPHGPYRLGGYSFGSLVAFEMARLLTDAGERIDALVLGDVPAPGPGGTGQLSLLSLGRLFDLPIDEPVFTKLSHEDQLTQMAAAMSEKLMLPTDVSESQRQLRVYRAHLHALTSYAPSISAVPVTLLRTEESARRLPMAGFSPGDTTFGWQSLCSRPVRVIDLPGDHINVIFVPAVAHLAEALRGVLREVDGSDRPA
ncbi:type I polyketide synthase [Polyangium sp. 15x6]|uniref:type I polyketide synthase n=1 Tax=Polyangium sp. 15x6 TaxID=3042687 RepID=UPI00249C5071|nr:type I polyketide synthase [Polyangium sp. 15x6]MDI3284907.1 beta-ketoacyl synthase N-terminal-like domain-containing protein [Polyangium sp. 15x6]